MLLLALAVFAAATPAKADSARFAVVNTISTETIKGLAWSAPRFTVTEQNQNGAAVRVALLRGTLSEPNVSLNVDDRLVLFEDPAAKIHKFTIPVPLQGPITPFVLTAVTARGEITTFKADLLLETDDGEPQLAPAKHWYWHALAALQPSFTDAHETYPSFGTGETYGWVDRAQLKLEGALKLAADDLGPAWEADLALTAGYSLATSGQSFPPNVETELRLGRKDFLKLGAWFSGGLDLDFESYPLLSSAIQVNATVPLYTATFQSRTLNLLWGGIWLRAAPQAWGGWELWGVGSHTLAGGSTVSGASASAPASYSGWRLAGELSKGIGERFFVRAGGAGESLAGDANISASTVFAGAGYRLR